MLKNVTVAQNKQKQTYKKRQEKGIRTFDFHAGDVVLKRNMRNVGRRGGKQDKLWTGPYRITGIDDYQRVTLEDVDKPGISLKSRVPYEQLRPLTESRLCKRPLSSLCVQSVQSVTPADGTDVVATAESSTSEVIVSIETSEDALTPRKGRRIDTTRSPRYRNPNMLREQIPRPSLQLFDEHRDHAQALLADDFPNIGSLQSTCIYAVESCTNAINRSESFIQILNVGGCHWVTVSNIRCPVDTLNVYDSMDFKLNIPDREKFLDQLSAMMKTPNSSFTVVRPQIQKQVGGSDCGLFAVAIATSLCFGDEPQGHFYYQYKMRDHLTSCYLTGKMGQFPSSIVEREGTLYSKASIKVYCHCRKPHKEGTFMARCNSCHEWYHRRCEKVLKIVSPETIFFCSSCGEQS